MPPQQSNDQFERFQPRSAQDDDKMESAFVQKTLARLRELDLDMNSLTPDMVKKLIAKYVLQQQIFRFFYMINFDLIMHPFQR